jgi:hypothetical protein
VWPDRPISPTLIAMSFAAVWFLVFLSTHVAVFHLRRVTNRFSVTVGLLAAAMAGCIVSMAAAGMVSWLSVINALTAMACFWVLYVPFYYVVANSTSVRILIAVEDVGGASDVKSVEARFASLEMLQNRLDTMAVYGHLVNHGSTFRLTAKGRAIARFFIVLKRLWRLGPGG